MEEEEEEEEDKAIASRPFVPAVHFSAVVLAGIALLYPPTAPDISSLRASSRSSCSTFVAKLRTRPKRERLLGLDSCFEERLIEAAAGHPLGPPVRQGYKNAVNWFRPGSHLVRSWFRPGSELTAGRFGCKLHLGRGCFFITTEDGQG